VIPNIRFLVAHGADPKGPLPEDVELPPAIISGVTCGKAAVVEELVALGADVNATDNSGNNAIAALLTHTLQQSEEVRILRTLIKAGANVNGQNSEFYM
jgi:Ankyrin repeat